jgi:hypothetical protein
VTGNAPIITDGTNHSYTGFYRSRFSNMSAEFESERCHGCAASKDMKVLHSVTITTGYGSSDIASGPADTQDWLETKPSTIAAVDNTSTPDNLLPHEFSSPQKFITAAPFPVAKAFYYVTQTLSTPRQLLKWILVPQSILAAIFTFVLNVVIPTIEASATTNRYAGGYVHRFLTYNHKYLRRIVTQQREGLEQQDLEITKATLKISMLVDRFTLDDGITHGIMLAVTHLVAWILVSTMHFSALFAVPVGTVSSLIVVYLVGVVLVCIEWMLLPSEKFTQRWQQTRLDGIVGLVGNEDTAASPGVDYPPMSPRSKVRTIMAYLSTLPGFVEAQQGSIENVVVAGGDVGDSEIETIFL